MATEQPTTGPGPAAELLYKLGRFFRSNALFVGSAVLLALSVYYFVGAQEARRALRRTETGAFASGTAVTIAGVIDGDEIAVRSADGHQTVVRLLGIRSFDPVRADPVVAPYGQACVNSISATFLGRDARLVLGEPRTDRHGRLLAYVELESGPDGTPEADLGLELVRQGLTLVYTRYDFDRLGSYLEAEVRASSERTGLWANDRVRARAAALKALWDEERSNG